MEWTTSATETALIARPVGRIDEASWQPFAERLIEAVGQAKGQPLIVDLSGVDYMSSRGLRSLTLARKAGEEAGVEIQLAGPNAVMREILAISRYDRIFRILDTADPAP